MKVKLFTHTDLDGLGCAVVAKRAFKDVEVEFCDYPTVNKQILDFLDNERITNYDRIFITDISFNDEVAERLDLIHRGGVSTVQLVDHHGTALHLAEKYPMWCHVRVEESNLAPFSPEPPFKYSPREKVMASGTSLFYKFLRNKHFPNIQSDATLKSFVETVRRYDTWEWNNVYQDDHPKKLNDLLYLVGRDEFLERFSKSPLATFTETELKLLEVEEFRINQYIQKKKKEVKIARVTVTEGTLYKVAYVYAENYGSILGNAIAEAYGDDIDFVALIDMATSKVSLRGIHDSLDLGKDVAQVMGLFHNTRGGGHSKACAFNFREGLGEYVFNKAFGVGE